jgi:hypothetical protein
MRTYAGDTVVMSIDSGECYRRPPSRRRRPTPANLPPRAMRLIDKRFVLHRDELRLNWARAREGTPLVAIDPLP